LSEDDIIVGMVGRLVPVKNHGMLIKAAGMLKIV
jgi:glycosyltransferase involved in cell wall biosynthesis